MEHIRIIAPGDPGFDWLYDLYMQSFPVHEQRLGSGRRGCWAIRSTTATCSVRGRHGWGC